MDVLTRKQQEVFVIIENFTRSSGYPPSVREVTARMGLSSAAGVHKHIKALVTKGYLSKEDFLSRSLKILHPTRKPRHQSDLIELPLAGYVAAGQPIEALEQNQETLPVPSALLGRHPQRHFVLKVRGDSMIGDFIVDGDYVIVEKRENAENGEVVVALLEEREATLKRFYKENGQVRLQPANSNMAPIIVDAGALRIQGVVVGVWRRF